MEDYHFPKILGVLMSNMDDFLVGARSCKRGSSPLFFCLNSSQSFFSRSRASVDHSSSLKRKWVTFMNVLRFLCERSLDCRELSLLPIYTTVSPYPNSYAPGLAGTSSTTSSLNGRHLALIGILGLRNYEVSCQTINNKILGVNDDYGKRD